MLLARNTDSPHPLGGIGPELRGHCSQHEIERFGPFVRVLLHVTDAQAFDHPMRGPGLCDDLAGHEIEHDRLDALGA